MKLVLNILWLILLVLLTNEKVRSCKEVNSRSMALAYVALVILTIMRFSFLKLVIIAAVWVISTKKMGKKLKGILKESLKDKE